MALLFMDSFDHYATADLMEKWSSVSALSAAATLSIAAGGRRSTSGLRWFIGTSSGLQGAAVRALAPADATCTMGFAILFPTGGFIGIGGVRVASIRDGSLVQLSLRVNADGTLSVLRDTTVLGTPSVATLPFGVATYVEWKATIHNSTGTVEVRLNGAPVLVLTSQDTQATATAQWTNIALGQAENIANSVTAGSSKNIDYDDVYVLDGSGAAPWNTFLGDCRVDAFLPSAAGASAQWTPSAGANYQCVDDNPPNDDTDSTTSSTTGHTDSFTYPDAPVAGAVIYGVQHCLNLKKLDAGTCTVAPVVRHSGTVYPGAVVSPGTSYAYGLLAQQVNPGTGAAWVEADFNAAEFGYQRVS